LFVRLEGVMILLEKRRFLAQSLVGSGWEWLLRKVGAWRGLLVLNYHRIGNPHSTRWDHDLWSATSEEFDWQVRHLKRHFDVVSPADFEQVRSSKRGRHIVISFDDGYRDNYDLAFPILRDHHVPATFFLATRFLDQPYVSWWDEVAWMIRSTDRQFLEGDIWLPQPVLIDHLNPQVTIRTLLKILKCLDGEKSQEFLNYLGQATGCGRCPAKHAADLWMNWDMVREMRAGGMNFGAHTVNHPVLSRLSIDRQRWEIVESRRRIEHELGEKVNTFSYPVGGQETCTEETRQCLRDEGFQWAFRYGVGYSRNPFKDPMQIPRLAVEQTIGRSMFRSLTTLPQLFD
jgi:peptidoglycan/xylan/chitin deacetylase (PgdA/CDA1 family)